MELAKTFNPEDSDESEGEQDGPGSGSVATDKAPDEAAATRLEKLGRRAWAKGTGPEGMTGKVKSAFLGDCSFPEELQAFPLPSSGKEKKSEAKENTR